MAVPIGGGLLEKFGVRAISYTVALGLAGLLLLIALSTCATTVENTEIGLAINNLTGEIAQYRNGGMVIHLPFGLTTVKTVDKSPHHLRLARDIKNGEHSEGDQIMIKTGDGSTVETDVDVIYQVDPEHADLAYRELVENTEGSQYSGRRPSHDSANNMESILRAVTRAEVRNSLGELTSLEMSDPDKRNAKLDIVLANLKSYFQAMGLEIVSVNAQNITFNEEYENLIRQRKTSDQTLVNQGEFKAVAEEKGKRLVADAEKISQTGMAQLQGDLSKKLRTAEGEAARIKTKAEQTVYQLEREAEIATANATQEAAAIAAEGQKKAEGLSKLFEAYEQGGEGLVREALTKLYEGVTINAKPYAPSDRIEQVQVTPAAAVSADPNSTTPPRAPRTGGSNGR